MLPCGLQEEEQAQQPNAEQGKGIEMEQDFEGSLEDMPQDDDGAGSEAEDGEEDRLQQVGTGGGAAAAPGRRAGQGAHLPGARHPEGTQPAPPAATLLCSLVTAIS